MFYMIAAVVALLCVLSRREPLQAVGVILAFVIVAVVGIVG